MCVLIFRTILFEMFLILRRIQREAWEAFAFDEQYNFENLCLILWYCDTMNLCWEDVGMYAR